jgi:hypothetical protein
MEWERVLECRRLYWNPDMPGGFSSAMPKLSERVQRAARASGVFKLIDCEPEDLHVWAKKKFIESYIAWEQLEQDQFLLPDGEVKNLLAGVAQAKALPSAEVSFEQLHARGLAYSEELKASGCTRSDIQREMRAIHAIAQEAGPRPPIDVEGRRRELQRQAELIQVRYAKTPKG